MLWIFFVCSLVGIAVGQHLEYEYEDADDEYSDYDFSDDSSHNLAVAGSISFGIALPIVAAVSLVGVYSEARHKNNHDVRKGASCSRESLSLACLVPRVRKNGRPSRRG